MIVLEITDESGVSHYDVLGLTADQVGGSQDPTRDVRAAAKKARKQYHVLAQRGDKDAEEKLARVNEAESVLKDAKKREEYDQGLSTGKGAALEVLRPRPVAPPVYRDRNVRFRVIEDLMRAAGLSRPVWGDPTAAGADAT